MNKKENLLAIALSASFVLAGANVAEDTEEVKSQTESQDTEAPNNGASQASQDEKKTEQESLTKPPENPDGSGEENPETPGEDKPNDPGTPGETPDKENIKTSESPKEDEE